MRTRIGTRLILATGAVAVTAMAGMAGILLRTHRNDLIAELNRSADQLSETVESSIYYDMLENRRENLHRQIVAIGAQKGIEKVRLFNKEGRIMFSSDAGEIGRAVDKRAEACTACHAIDRPLERLPIPARSRIYRGAGGERVLGMINPIQNRPDCANAACHAHDPGQRVLGVLDVNVSLAEVDRGIARSQAKFAALALLATLAGTAILWYANRVLVVKPVAALAAGTRRVAEGDLSTTLPAAGDHELGELARAFNDMTRRLAEAQRQITLSDKLASVGRLAAGVAHEINNPLTGVLTYASFLLKRSEDRPELKADLEVIVRETKRCREIVKGLLDFARPSPPRRQPTDLNDTARKAVAIVMNRLSLGRVALSLDLADDLPPVSADPNQIQQVLVNLLVNAADAIGNDGGTIRLLSRPAIVSPFGFLPIRQARCPNGCDLVDSANRVGGMPAIRVLLAAGGREGVVFLDPVYGRFNHRAAEPQEEGGVADFHCPRCRVSLRVEGEHCGKCGAETFAVEVPGPGRVRWCRRIGCHWARWPEAEAAGDRRVVELRVEDTGHGIAEAELAHLFEPFFSTKGTRGTGLGLAVSWGIVDAHGGTIEVTSREGAGSRFIVRLPLEAGEALPVSVAEAPPVPAAAGHG